MRRTPRAALIGAMLIALGGTALADPKSDALFQKAREALTAARALEAEATQTFVQGERKGSFTASIRLMKPNLGQFIMQRSMGELASDIAMYSDGKEFYQVMPSSKQYRRMPAQPKGMGPLNIFVPLKAFFEPETLIAHVEHKHIGTREVDGKSYEVVQFLSTARPEGMTRYFFGVSGLLEGMEVDLKQDPPGSKMTFWLKNLNLNPSFTEKEFAYTPPADYKLHDPLAALEGSLLKVGASAPDFRLPQPDGGPLTLSGLRKGKKAVLINFWFYG